MEETVKTEGTTEEVATPTPEKSVEELLLEKIEHDGSSYKILICAVESNPNILTILYQIPAILQ